MCNKLKLKIKSCSCCAPKVGFLPCGKCIDCRNSNRSQWVFRLRWELDSLVDKGWQIGFFTLTYNDDSLPRLPLYLFQNLGDYEKVPCFNRFDVSSFVQSLRDWARLEYGVRNSEDSQGLRYMICAEYGEHTQRPHYHGIVCFPPTLPARAIYDKITELWTGLHSDGSRVVNPITHEAAKQFGFIFPRCFEGGFDSHGYEHKPFVCDSTKAAAVYASKYVCKDISYMDFLQRFELRDIVKVFRSDCVVENYQDVDFDFLADTAELVDSVRLVRKRIGDEPLLTFKLRDYLPFHVQSKSLGLGFLSKLSDSDKLRYLKDGYGFVGDDSNSPLPIYIKNKIIFNPVYVYDLKTHKRLVRRNCTEFFNQHLADVFDAKVEQVKEKFDNFLSLEYWRSLGAGPADLDYLSNLIGGCPFNSLCLAESYLSCYGVSREHCYAVSPAVNWYARYDDNLRLELQNSGVELVDGDFLDELDFYVGSFFSAFVRYDSDVCRKKMFDAREVSRIDDYWRSME